MRSVRGYITKAKGGLYTLTIRVNGEKVWATNDQYADKHQTKSDASAELARWKAENAA